ncbi:hypothetical protein ACFVAJ_18785 [Agromyces sp. NPDC057679]|uniref:hypothetical protein n=1 Tax=Agromyces sp. NPDC057679 TaxID=3346207 RepID=UPI003672575C
MSPVNPNVSASPSIPRGSVACRNPECPRAWHRFGTPDCRKASQRRAVLGPSLADALAKLDSADDPTDVSDAWWELGGSLQPGEPGDVEAIADETFEAVRRASARIIRAAAIVEATFEYDGAKTEEELRRQEHGRMHMRQALHLLELVTEASVAKTAAANPDLDEDDAYLAAPCRWSEEDTDELFAEAYAELDRRYRERRAAEVTESAAQQPADEPEAAAHREQSGWFSRLFRRH